MSADCHLEGVRFTKGTYLALTLISAAIIAYELFIMRVFANGGWSHFGSTVVSIAMFGFGIFSTALCLFKDRLAKRMTGLIGFALLLLGPVMILANAAAQTVPFNPIFLVSDPNQKYYLSYYFALYFAPFLLGAMFIGLCFLSGRHGFGRVYFANMAGSGLGGMVLFAGMYVFLPQNLFYVPLTLWAAGALLWFLCQGQKKSAYLLALSAAIAVVLGMVLPQINVSPYKGVSYADKFPDAKRVHLAAGPFGKVEVYSSSYFHFAPGLSDVASLYLEEMPENAYLGMYIDGDGPIGIMKDLSGIQAEYIRFLPLSMPYLLKDRPDTLIMQFGGGISTNVALEMGAGRVTVAEGNPLIVRAVRDNEYVASFTGRILDNPKVQLVETDGRIVARRVKSAYDVVDLSLADSTGLSMPGGFSIHEKYSYTKETFIDAIEALKDGGIFSITIWNKEDPPKSTLKLMATICEAAREVAPAGVGDRLFIAHTYLSTLTILYKKGGFNQTDVETLTAYCEKMNFEPIHHPGIPPQEGDLDRILQAYRDNYFAPQKNEEPSDEVDFSAGQLYRLAVGKFIEGQWEYVADRYVFDSSPLTNDSPYFAGFVKMKDVPAFLPQLESIADEWGYLLLWATLLSSIFFGGLLMLVPVVFGWRAFFSGHRGKIGIVVYFMCLGLGYIMIEIGLIGKYVLILGNPTVSIAVLITGMLVFSGIGSYFSGRIVPSAGRALTLIVPAIALIMILYAGFLDDLFRLVDFWPYWTKVVFCLALLFPPAFLMGFPFAAGMTTLSNLNKEVFFVWAWGINGSFSVVASVLAPILGVNLGQSRVLIISAGIYLLTLPAFMYLRRPDRI